MRDLSSAVRCLLFVFVFVTAIGVSAQSPSRTQNASLSTILNTDGSVKPNITGSFDPGGYRLAYGLNGEPRFVTEPQPVGGCVPDAWDTTFTANGADNTVEVIVSDGTGNLYIAGTFNNVNSVPSVRIAKWNGTAWSALGSGIIGSVNAMAVSGSDLYVGGQFTSAGGVPALNIAKWNGTSWSQVGPGIGTTGNRFVNAIAVSGSDLYVGGTFTIATGAPADAIARWDGASWNAVGTGIIGTVETIAITGSSLYAGGSIALPGGGSSIGLLKWDGASWSSLGTSSNTTIKEIAISGTDIYVIGFIVLPGQPNSHVAKLNGTTWTRLGFFADAIVSAVAVVGTDLYVGGSLPSPPNFFNNLAKWNGTTWTGVGTGVTGGTSSNAVRALAASGNTIYVGGSFTLAGGIGARNIATLTNGTTWAAAFPGTGVDGSVGAIAVSGTDVYVGGSFISAGPVTANRIAKWNGVTNTWSALGGGISGGSISAIAVVGNKVYAGGTFSTIGGISASNIAVWNGTNWSALGTGVNAWVTEIVPRGEDIYAGGSFTTAGGVTANRVAKWNGTSWSGLNSAIIPTTVSGMAFLGTDLYVSTTTTTADNPAYLTKYDGTTWTALAGSMGGHGLHSVAVIGTDVYIAGGFTAINGSPFNRIAKWSNGSWSALGAGLPSPIGQPGYIKLAAVGNDLIAVGDFTVAGGGPAERIARWNGTAWSALGNGLNGGNPGTVTAAGGDIFAGGGFTTAGCNLSPYFARWRETLWTGSTNTDWHTGSNWGSGSIPVANAGITILSNNASISSADVTVSSLIVSGGRTLTIGAGRTLTVTGNLDLSNGSLAGPGALLVNGDLNLNNGNITGLGSIVINGTLYLSGGNITGAGPVAVTSCRSGAIMGGSNTSFISSLLTRCVNASGIYRFPIGTDSIYSPVALSNVVGSANFTVDPKSGPYSGQADGLSVNRLQRWWQLTNGGIARADVTFNYSDSEIVGLEGAYRVYRINGGVAEHVPAVLDTAANTATVSGVTSFSPWTLAEAPAAIVSVGGRVTRPDGRGAPFISVTLSDTFGGTWTVLTKYSGHYQFDNVVSPRSYTVSVAPRKRITFAVSQRVVTVSDNIADVNFVSNWP